jgi:hypothetical protein
MKLLKTIRFDPSDTQVFERAAEPDEWAIPGGFAFAGTTQSSLTGKRKQAFSNGFLSLGSFGHSTFTSVAEITDVQIESLVTVLAQHFADHYGAPSADDARTTAREEIDFTTDLCHEAQINSVFALSRFFDDAGDVREEFRLIDPPGEKLHARVWDVVED